MDGLELRDAQVGLGRVGVLSLGFFGAHIGTAMDAGVVGKAFLLDGAGLDDAFADGGGGFAGSEGGEFLISDWGDFHVDIDAVEERAGDLIAVSLDLGGRCTGNCVAGRSSIRMGTHAGDLYNFSKSLGSKAFAKGYPSNPRTMGERVRKARLDAGLSVKELAAHIGVSPDTILNWELRGMDPRWHLEAVKETLGMDG